MQQKLKKKLSLLLVLVLIVSLFPGLSLNAAAEDGTSYLAFASDVHYDTDYKQNNLDVWLKDIQKTGAATHLDYMGFCGDMGSAYDSGLTYWTDVQTDISLVDSYIASGYIDKAEYTMGNHEWFVEAGGDFGTYYNNDAYPEAKATCDRFLRIGESANTADYITYCFGSWGEVASDTSKYGFGDTDIATLNAYLSTAPNDIPIFIMSHFPLHSFSGRNSLNADKVITLLNEHPNTVFVYGHNHSVYDTNYDTINEAGDYLNVSGTDTQINFTYTSAGCMSDSEYSAGSHFVMGKGLIVKINGSAVNFTHYDMDGNPVNDSRTIDMSTVGDDHSGGPFTVKFKDGHTNQMIKYETVAAGASATEPAHAKYEGYLYTGWDQDFSSITRNITVTATYMEKPEPLAAQSELDKNYIYISLYVNHDPAVGTSGTPIVFYPIPWTEGLTVDDAVFKVHELEYADGTAGVAINSDNGFDCYSTIWGHTPKYNTLAFDDASWVDGAAATTGGDVYYLLAYDDSWITTSFIKPNTTAAVVGEYITLQALTMNMNSDYTYTPKGYVGDIYVGTSLDSLTDTGVNSDSKGAFTISFDQPGKYYVAAKSSSRGDGIAVVNVTANTGDYVYINLSIDGSVMYDKDGNYITHYPMVLSAGDTINDIMTKLHAHAYGAGSAWTSYDKDGTTYVTCLWGLDYETNCANIYLNNSAQSVSASTVLKGGDVIDVNGYTAERSRASMFDIKYAEIAVGETITLTASNAGADGYLPNSLTPINIDFKDTSYVTDSDGRVTLQFDKDGTYIITGEPLLNSTCPVCVIKVGEGGPMVNANDIPEGTPVGTVNFYAVIDNDILKDTEGKEIVCYPVPLYEGDTIADAITTLHKEAYGDAAGWGYTANSVYGHDLTMLWGIPVGGSYFGGVWTDFSAYKHADVTAAATDGMSVYLNSYSGSSAYFRCGFFAKPYEEVYAGDSLTLTMRRSSGDSTAKPCVTEVFVDGMSAGTTDATGKITLTFTTPGKHLVTGAGGASWTKAVCLVNVAVGKAYCYAVLDTNILKDTAGNQIVYYPVTIYEGDTVADVVTRLHQQATGNGAGWSYTANSVYGHDLTMLWGTPVIGSYFGGVWTDFSAYKHADVTAAAVSGMTIYLNSYSGSSAYFRCGFFEKPYEEVYTGDALTLTMRRSSGDSTAKPCVTEVFVDGVSAGTTDATGKITLTFTTPGKHLVTGTGSASWTTAVCLVNVTDKPFAAVTDITGVPADGTTGTPLALTGSVIPAEATNQTIVWTLKSGDAAIADGVLTATSAGDVVVTAAIANGTADGTDFTKDFTITFTDPFFAVTDITGVPTTGIAGIPLTLTGAAVPADATNNAIIWTVKSGDAAIADGTVLTAASAGDVVVTATIANGMAVGTDFTKDFTISIAPFVPITDITGVPTIGAAGTPLALTGTAIPADATHQTIVWSLKYGNATITEGNMLTAAAPGKVIVTATITDGTAVGTSFTKDFIIKITKAFVAVTDITGVPTAGIVGKPLLLNGFVMPANATNKPIVWTVKSGDATISHGKKLTAAAAGTVVVTATIINGTAVGTDFTKDFTITFTSRFIAVKEIVGVPKVGAVGTPLALTGSVMPGDATNQTIVWTVKSGAATISDGNILTATAAGYVVVTAKITDGAAIGKSFIKNFKIKIESFIAVTDIIRVPAEGTVGKPLALKGSAVPSNATNKMIVWAVKSGDAIITHGNILTASTAGTVVVTATITNGAADGTSFTKDFTITFTKHNHP